MEDSYFQLTDIDREPGQGLLLRLTGHTREQLLEALANGRELGGGDWREAMLTTFGVGGVAALPEDPTEQMQFLVDLSEVCSESWPLFTDNTVRWLAAGRVLPSSHSALQLLRQPGGRQQIRGYLMALYEGVYL